MVLLGDRTRGVVWACVFRCAGAMSREEGLCTAPAAPAPPSSPLAHRRPRLSLYPIVDSDEVRTLSCSYRAPSTTARARSQRARQAAAAAALGADGRLFGGARTTARRCALLLRRARHRITSAVPITPRWLLVAARRRGARARRGSLKGRPPSMASSSRRTGASALAPARPPPRAARSRLSGRDVHPPPPSLRHSAATAADRRDGEEPRSAPKSSACSCSFLLLRSLRAAPHPHAPIPLPIAPSPHTHTHSVTELLPNNQQPWASAARVPARSVSLSERVAAAAAVGTRARALSGLALPPRILTSPLPPSHPQPPTGRRNDKTHTLCRRCGRRSYHVQKTTCSSCGYPAARKRTYQWGKKAIGRKTTGTGRMRHMKDLPRRFKNGFREGTQAAPRVAASA